MQIAIIIEKVTGRQPSRAKPSTAEELLLWAAIKIRKTRPDASRVGDEASAEARRWFYEILTRLHKKRTIGNTNNKNNSKKKQESNMYIGEWLTDGSDTTRITNLC